MASTTPTAVRTAWLCRSQLVQTKLASVNRGKTDMTFQISSLTLVTARHRFITLRCFSLIGLFLAMIWSWSEVTDTCVLLTQSVIALLFPVPISRNHFVMISAPRKVFPNDLITFWTLCGAGVAKIAALHARVRNSPLALGSMR
ncbi:hypothetical protein M378DRAFT_168415 [Amanita muscaria Koide BX008]|uniref:Uncharacterized protein n=1 Tax=Amanita muscaria (strain Koide BX008) TaxID=946122 RepID=A0A0C2WTQ8_AMAMK|nr:hypothetical protein M378DRAFT_168415 [Amanita muscaria Koide BX008]